MQQAAMKYALQYDAQTISTYDGSIRAAGFVKGETASQKLAKVRSLPVS
jgi:hypothetical protein